MKLYEVKSEFLTNHDEIKAWLDYHGVNEYVVNNDGTVDVTNESKASIHAGINSPGVNFSSYADARMKHLDKLSKIPVKFRKVHGMFMFQGHKMLRSLKGCPDEVTDYFAVWDCPNIKSLQYSPKTVGDTIRLSGVGISSLDHLPKILSETGTLAITACTKLTSLKGSPSKVFEYFCNMMPQLTSFEGCPEIVEGPFYANGSGFTSLKGMPKKVGGFQINDTKIRSLKDIHKLTSFIENNGNVHLANAPIKDGYLDLLKTEGFLGIVDVYNMEGDQKAVCDIINKHADKGKSGIIEAQQELIDADLEDYI